MKKYILAAVAFFTIGGIGLFAFASGEKSPKFADFPVRTISTARAPLKIDTPKAQQYADALKQGYKASVNFAGHYVFVQLPAGTRCDTGALIDTQTGGVSFLDFAACFWDEVDEQPFYVNPNSLLFVASGKIGEGGVSGSHYFMFFNGQMRKFKSIATPPKYASEQETTSTELPFFATQGNLIDEDICGDGVRSAVVERDVGGRRIPLDHIVKDDDSGTMAWPNLDNSGGDLRVWCQYQNGDSRSFKLSANVENCSFDSHVTTCASRSSFAAIEPSAGRVDVVGDEEAMEALTTAILFAIHRPAFNENWKRGVEKFGHENAQALAFSFAATSMVRSYHLRDSNYYLLYNPSADLFALIRNGGDKKQLGGFVTGRKLSEELYQIKESDQMFENMLRTRPLVVQRFFNDFEKLPEYDDLFIQYRKSEEPSVLVNLNLVAYSRLLDPKNICRQQITDAINASEIVFEDGKTVSELRPFHLTVWFPLRKEETDAREEAVMFVDEGTRSYTGYAIFENNVDQSCKITKLISNQFFTH